MAYLGTTARLLEACVARKRLKSVARGVLHHSYSLARHFPTALGALQQDAAVVNHGCDQCRAWPIIKGSHGAHTARPHSGARAHATRISQLLCYKWSALAALEAKSKVKVLAARVTAQSKDAAPQLLVNVRKGDDIRASCRRSSR
jgi:hypothetical protein